MAKFRFLDQDSQEPTSTLESAQSQVAESPKQKGKFRFVEEEKSPKEGKLKSIARTLLQLPKGLLKKFTYPADLIQMLGTFEALNPEEVEQIRKISERSGIPFDEQEYEKNVGESSSLFPSQSNIERLVENKTGLPLEAQTPAQKFLNFFGTLYGFTPGTQLQKGTAGLTGNAIKSVLEYSGVPEPISELVAFGGGIGAGRKAPPIGIGAKTKPSGLPVRRFENLKEPREVSSSKVGKIHENLESDFKNISDKIIAETPAGITKEKLADNPAFKQIVTQQFNVVENLAESLPERFHTKEVRKKIVENLSKKKGTGFAPSEYDQDYINFIQKFKKETTSKKIGAADLVAQYRKNNKSIGEAYDPTRPYAYNRAKKDALLDYNRAISNLIEEKFPNSEFSNLFRKTNKQWAEIADVEAIDKFIDAMFDPTKSGVQFGKGKRFFENENYARPFKRGLGEEGFKQFEQLMKDMLSTEKPAKMLKIAKKRGWQDLAETAGAFILHPTIGKAKLGFQAAKSTYKGLINSLLDKPQIGITWERGVENLKAGKFSEAERDFNFLKKEAEKYETKAGATVAKRPNEITTPERKKIELKEPAKVTEPKQIESAKTSKQIEFKQKAKPIEKTGVPKQKEPKKPVKNNKKFNNLVQDRKHNER